MLPRRSINDLMLLFLSLNALLSLRYPVARDFFVCALFKVLVFGVVLCGKGSASW
jgi:hypothetical protein